LLPSFLTLNRFIERITLDVIEEDEDFKPNGRVTICISGYMSDNAANSNWNEVIKARPHDRIIVSFRVIVGVPLADHSNSLREEAERHEVLGYDQE
jgi:hypothetical protein